ncbi:MAG TPA: hypothetical protein VKF38_12625 [Anaerolineaceae bacterium]|nr:hypothetical protein [Anaerolineaceae bacterium]
MDNPFDNLKKQQFEQSKKEETSWAKRKNIANSFSEMVIGVLQQLREAMYPPNKADFDVPEGLTTADYNCHQFDENRWVISRQIYRRESDRYWKRLEHFNEVFVELEFDASDEARCFLCYKIFPDGSPKEKVRTHGITREELIKALELCYSQGY